MRAGHSPRCGNLLLFLSRSNPPWIPVYRLCGLVQAATSAWIEEGQVQERGKPQDLSGEERVAWVATTAHFGHLKITASLSPSFFLPHKDYGGSKRRKALTQKGKKLHKIIFTARDFLMFIGCAPQLNTFDQTFPMIHHLLMMPYNSKKIITMWPICLLLFCKNRLGRLRDYLYSILFSQCY